MKNKISIINRIGAILLSVLFCVTLINSFFSMPIELILLNKQSYQTIFEEEDYANLYPSLITELLVPKLYSSYHDGNVPEVLSDNEKFKDSIQNYIPADWSVNVIKEFAFFMIDFLNFQIPESSLRLDIGTLKLELIENRTSIARDYFSRLPNCTLDEGARLELGDIWSIRDLPGCKPAFQTRDGFIDILSLHLEDLFNRLPSTASVMGIMPVYEGTNGENFYYYSIARWVLRLMPIITIGLMILISFLLHRERPVMLKWCGKLLVFASAVTLVALIVLIIGFDQFIALSIDRYFEGLVVGFDSLLLGMVQEIGHRTLVWVIISVIIALIFGLMLTLTARLFKSESSVKASRDESIPETDRRDESTSVKEFQPETMEEIEDREKKNKK